MPGRSVLPDAGTMVAGNDRRAVLQLDGVFVMVAAAVPRCKPNQCKKIDPRSSESVGA